MSDDESGMAAVLAECIADREVKEVARKAVEDELIEWRDAGRFVLRNNGCVVKYEDGTPSDIIRFGPETAVLIGVRAVAAHVAAALAEAGYGHVGQARAEALTETVRATSRAISGSYPSGLDPEAHMWRRCAKVHEEAGEVTEALLGYIGENPRKGTTHSLDDLVGELLDVANCALGAVDYLRPDADPVALLTEHSRQKWERLNAVLRDRADREAGEQHG